MATQLTFRDDEDTSKLPVSIRPLSIALRFSLTAQHLHSAAEIIRRDEYSKDALLCLRLPV
jgi:hypothetical protein